MTKLISILTNTTPFSDICVLASLAVYSGVNAIASIISSEDWDKITGPHGLVFVLICALIVVWTKSVKDDNARERRHREVIAVQEEHFKALLKLNEKTSSDLRILTVAATKAQLTSANAVVSMEKTITKLSEDISESCQITKQEIAILRDRIENQNKIE